MGHTFLIWKPLISVFFVLAIGAQNLTLASELKDFPEPVVAVSPIDGAVWMGTSSEGLLRFGRNGKSLRYTAEDGQLPSDQILSLVFDASGALFILDGSGALTRYSSVDGFASVPSFGSDVKSLSVSPDHTYVYITRGERQFVLSEEGVSEVTPAPEAEVPAVVEESSAAVKKSSLPAWLLFVLGLVVGGGLAALLLRRRKVSEEPLVRPSVQPAVKPLAKPVEAPVRTAPVAPAASVAPSVATDPSDQSIEQALQNSSFGRQVWDLVVAHLSSSAYGVEEVARDLDLSRIHVNRKLKAETGYSPSAVFKFIRMNHASKLLLEGNHSVADVARDCGFSSASYFSTAFKEYYSQSPSEFLAENHLAQ